jgi:hypothetical protein
MIDSPRTASRSEFACLAPSDFHIFTNSKRVPLTFSSDFVMIHCVHGVIHLDWPLVRKLEVYANGWALTTAEGVTFT